MNRERRRTLLSLKNSLEELKEVLDMILEEETDYFDNLPESAKDSERWEESEVAIDILVRAQENFEEFLSLIGEITG